MKVKTILLGLASLTALAAAPAFADRGHGHGKHHFKHHHFKHHSHQATHYRPVVVVPPRVVYHQPAPVYYHPAPVYHQPAPSYGAGTVSIRLNLPL
jgi:hypothetical protein